MIVEVLTEWNELTAVMTAWLGCVGLAVAVDFGPEIYQEKVAAYRKTKARRLLEHVTIPMIIQAAARPTHAETMQLFAIQQHDAPAKRRHANVAA